MSHDEANRTDRRTFLQAGALATTAALSAACRRLEAQTILESAGPSQAQAR